MKFRKRHQRSGRRRVTSSEAGVSGAPAAAEDDGQPELKPVRLQKILAAAGMASRRGSEEYLRDGRVTVNGRLAKLGDSADPLRDIVAVDGEPLYAEKPAYWVVNKPAGVLTTLRDPEGRATVVSLLPSNTPRVFPVGRLDRDTSGLVLLTNDGPLAHRLLHPSLGNEREYRVTARGQLLEQHCEWLRKGIRLEDGITSPAIVDSLHYDSDKDVTVFSLTLREGKKRQIRRTMLALRHPVKRLVRVRVGPIRLGKLPRGAARSLTAAEIQTLRAHCAELTSSPPPRRVTRARPRTVRPLGKKPPRE